MELPQCNNGARERGPRLCVMFLLGKGQVVKYGKVTWKVALWGHFLHCCFHSQLASPRNIVGNKRLFVGAERVGCVDQILCPARLPVSPGASPFPRNRLLVFEVVRPREEKGPDPSPIAANRNLSTELKWVPIDSGIRRLCQWSCPGLCKKRAWGDSSPSCKRRADQYHAPSGTRDGAGPSDRSPVLRQEQRGPIPLALVPAMGVH
ncbi:hypothetical protein UY3_18062 [Chelonia mydas]|uniref:Uncharacterized protein n=1 Tax=Chelonia mydas TaxID=8469 RepID=M7AIK5_CHEMY|nr:hypothetical protein UY3_18062 [Chelonia mydas]